MIAKNGSVAALRPSVVLAGLEIKRYINIGLYWIRRLYISKFAVMLVCLIMASAALLALVQIAIGISNGVRAYVDGEARYSKGQKDAVYYLTRYIDSRSEQDYNKYLKAIAVPLGDQKARVELQKPEFDEGVATQGFIEGLNAPNDIPSMIQLFRRYQDVSYMANAIAIWTLADEQISLMKRLGDELHGDALTRAPSERRIAEISAEIERIHVLTSQYEYEFSKVLLQGAEMTRRVLGGLIFFVALTLLSAWSWMTWRISHELRQGVAQLHEAALKAAQGELVQSGRVNTGDPLADLANIFNNFVEYRGSVEAKLSEAVQMREKIMHSVTNAIFSLDLQGKIILVNRRSCALTGYDESELVGVLFDGLFPKERLSELRKIFERVIRLGEKVDHYETPLVCKDGHVIMISFSCEAIYKDGTAIGVVGAAEDITERKLYEARLLQQANYDALTGLPNRNLLNDRVSHSLSRAQRTGKMVALVFIDLDGFKLINDSFGHALGDELLKAVAAKLGGVIRAGDTVARMGGDEFVLVLGDLDDEDDVKEITGKILHALSAPFILDRHELRVTASIGVSFYPKDGRNYTSLLKSADIAMYSAKNEGHNCAMFFDSEMASREEQREELESAMHDGIAQGDFKPHYQPQVSLHTGKICSAEMLMRWQHAKLGMIPPVRFIPMAEDTGMIKPLGELALRQACRQLGKLREMGHLDMAIAVNLSPHQFLQQNLPGLLLQLLEETGAEAGGLHLEITESVILQDSKEMMKTLWDLKSIGVVLVLDNFGNGFTSLGRLKRVPLDIIKIDQSIILSLMTSADSTAIIRAITAVAKSLNLKVVAEGVETQDQLDFLIASGCDVAQGFYLGRALTDLDFMRLLSKRHQLLPASLLRCSS